MPTIEKTSFGSITIDGKIYEYDVVIRVDGEIKKRKKKLSKEIYGTSHIVSLDEIKHITKDNPDSLYIGTGQDGMLELSKEAKEYLKKEGIEFHLAKTPDIVDKYNEGKGKKSAMIHITC